MKFRITVEKQNDNGEIENHIYRNYEYEDMEEVYGAEFQEIITDMIETLYDTNEPF